MFSLEPQRTQFDLHFQVFGIPTRIHPGFWLVSFLLGFNQSDGGRNPLPVLLFMGVSFISILVHELGHALVMRRFGFAPRMVLYHLGGLAIREKSFSGFESRRGRNDTWESILISLAGPGAGFLLAGFVIVMIYVGQGSFMVDWSRLPNIPWRFAPATNWPLAFIYVVEFALFLNIFWGLINLVPVLPLDGGQIARELLSYRDRYNGLTHALQLSIGVGIVMAAFLWLFMHDQYAAMMFALLAISNYITLQQVGRFT